MERIQTNRRISTGPIVLLMAFLAVLALGLTGWYVMSTSPSPSRHPAATTTSGFPGPDAADRNSGLQKQLDPNSTHGH